MRYYSDPPTTGFNGYTYVNSFNPVSQSYIRAQRRNWSYSFPYPYPHPYMHCPEYTSGPLFTQGVIYIHTGRIYTEEVPVPIYREGSSYFHNEYYELINKGFNPGAMPNLAQNPEKTDNTIEKKEPINIAEPLVDMSVCDIEGNQTPNSYELLKGFISLITKTKELNP
ncbi:hypothetical protein GWI33_004063 [Rhynchophorus ferrugineus]|uniref:Uncharacterized protein n=1 Tax=Rhynchophorus ferrugineus TaxID=354439 RepID=A0A834IMR6_RHYFE|nr:hypothetical protein GWI33_004063 [Rhynchophorus ferrugineus]